jgi:FkbM family methyltransferase
MAVSDLRALAQRAVGRVLYAPKVAIDDVGPLKRLGSGYGGWTFVADPALRGATIVSAGLGEDASFDVEIARAEGATVLLVDPTPRAVAHYGALAARIGSARTRDYADGGCQPAEAYPLEGVAADQLRLIDKALWTEVSTLKFYMPPNEDHVSHSLTNFQNDYRTDTPAIEVESTTLPDLMRQECLPELQMLKLDIEGAEIDVLTDMLDRGIKPRQLLIEFDELTKHSKRGLERWQAMDGRLRSTGYRCGYFDQRSCFLYVRKA